jgi:hypothetical protein
MMVLARISRVGCGLSPLRRGMTAAVLTVSLAGCVPPDVTGSLPDVPTRWDHRPEADTWTAAAFVAVSSKDSVLASRVPGDIAAWCPGYEDASLNDRRAFWVGLMSAVAKHESTWNPRASGGGGRYIGLMQISPQTARSNGCDATSSGALKDGGANLTCAVEVFSRDVARDGLVAGKGNRGIGRQWGPFRKSSKRAEMASWTSQQPYCEKG